MADYFSSHPCVDCGQDDIRCLEFDHRDAGEKLADVATLLRSRVAWSRIEAEIAKCDVRCANCHRRATALRGGSWRVAVHAERAAAATAVSSARLTSLFS